MEIHSMNFVGKINILDRGDGPAQEVLDRTARDMAQRRSDETRDELNKVMTRVEKTLGQFELTSELQAAGATNMEYINDLDELQVLLSDTIKKRKYQQQITVFIVGYQNICTNRLKIIQQVNEFFVDTTNRWEEIDLAAVTPDIDLDEAHKSVTESLQTASELTARIADLNKEMIEYMYQQASAKAGNKNRKKLEKALIQAKDDAALMSSNLLALQRELEEKDEKIQQLFKQVEMKSVEVQKYKAVAEVAKKSVNESSNVQGELDAKDQQLKDMQKTIDRLQMEVTQKESSREATQKELLTSGRETLLKIRELENQLQTKDATQQAAVRDLNDYHDRQISNLSLVHRQEIQEVKKSYEEEIAKLKAIKMEIDQDSKTGKSTGNPKKKKVSRVDSKSDDESTQEAAVLKPEPAQVKLPEDFENEAVWESYPMQQAQSAFTQYRQFTTSKVKQLNDQCIASEERAAKKVSNLKGQFQQHKRRWHVEQSLLVKQIELSQRIVGEAEQDAEKAIVQLEEFISEAEQLEKEEEASALTRQTQLTANVEKQKVSAAPVISEPDLLAQTDDAKSLKQTSPGPLLQVTTSRGTVDQSAMIDPQAAKDTPAVSTWDPRQPTADHESVPNSRHGRRSVTFNGLELDLHQADQGSISSRERADVSIPNSGRYSISRSQRPQSLKSFYSEKGSNAERIISSLKQLMTEDALDSIQSKVLSSLRASFVKSEPETDVNEDAIGVFSLASVLSAETLHLGFKPEGLFRRVLALYSSGATEYKKSTGDDMQELSAVTRILIEEQEDLRLAKFEKSQPVIIDVAPMSRDPAKSDDISSAKVRFANQGTPEPNTPSGSSHSERPEENLDSGRSTPHSRLSSLTNKYRASAQSARNSLADRRSSSPQLAVPDIPSFEAADLDENADVASQSNNPERGTSVGSSLYIRQNKSTAMSYASSKREKSASQRDDEDFAELYNQTPLGYHDKSTAVTPKMTVNAQTSSFSPKRSSSNYSREELLLSSETPPVLDNPIVLEFLKVYKAISDHKEALSRVLLDKDMMSASQILSEIETRELDSESLLITQIEDMGSNCRRTLEECVEVVNGALNAALSQEYNVSTLASRDATYLRELNTPSTISGGPLAPSPSWLEKIDMPAQARPPSLSRSTPKDSSNLSELQLSFKKLQSDFDVEVKNHQEDLRHNVVLVQELQHEILLLRSELNALQKERTERATDSGIESPIMFTRLDAERNAKNLKRAVNNDKLSEDRYNTALAKMDAYVSIPAKRFAELVKKYVHHTNMKHIEDVIKNRRDLESAEQDMLKKMGALQSERTKRWMEKMDALGEQRLNLANELMSTLEELEQESGIFLIKPMFSYRSIRHIENMIASKALRVTLGLERKGNKQHPSANLPSDRNNNSNVAGHPRTTVGMTSKVPVALADRQAGKQPRSDGWVADKPKQSGGPSWSMQASIPSSDPTSDHPSDLAAINTPLLLELDVNRMMYGHNQVSMKTNPYMSNDRLVNAANSSVRSYMTVSRPVAVRSLDRPSSSGEMASRSLAKTPEAGFRQDSHSAGMRMTVTPPLPPISRGQTMDARQNSSVNPSRLAREFTDDSIHQLPHHVTRIASKFEEFEMANVLTNRTN